MAIELVDFKSATSPNGSSWTFTGVNLGAAADDRYIFVVAGGRRVGGSGTRQITNVTAGGQATSDVISTAGLAVAAGIRRTSTPLTAGTSGTVAVTFDADMESCWIAVYRATELASLTPVDTASAAGSGLDASLPLDVLPGFALGGMTIQVASGNVRRGSAASRSFTSAASAHAISAAGSGAQIDWSGLDKDGDANISEGSQTQDFYTAVAASFALNIPAEATSSGVATVSGVGTRGRLGVASSGGTATVSGVGTAGIASEGTTAGITVVDGQARAEASVVAGAGGGAAVLGDGASDARAEAGAGGDAAVLGDGASDARATAAATAIAAVSGVGLSWFSADAAAAAGTATMDWHARIDWFSVAGADGEAVTDWHARSEARADATADGAAPVLGIGRAVYPVDVFVTAQPPATVIAMRVPATHIIARLSPTTRVEVRQSTVEASQDGVSVSMPALGVTQLGNP